jgi:hypothetical protein
MVRTERSDGRPLIKKVETGRGTNKANLCSPLLISNPHRHCSIFHYEVHTMKVKKLGTEYIEIILGEDDAYECNEQGGVNIILPPIILPPEQIAELRKVICP